jgi:hypothetical protein
MTRRATRNLRAASARYSLLAVRDLLFAICCSLLALFLFCGPLPAQTPQEVQKTAEQVIRKLDLQTTLPREPERQRFTFRMPGEVLWLVIIVALGVLIYAFRDYIPIWRWGRGGAWTPDETAADGGEARAPAAVLGAADDLAAEGRFVEAMHVLLLQSLADIRAGLDEQFADSLTSREILRSSTKLSEAGRASLRDIINRVEWTYFGEHPAALPDYEACRASFNALIQAMHGGVPQRSAA